MQLFQDFLDRSKQLNQTPAATAKLPYHAPKHHYKFIYQGLIFLTCLHLYIISTLLVYWAV